MKKALSICLAVLMVASIVAMIPVFTASAAAETEDYLGGYETAEIVLTKKEIATKADSYAITSGHSFNVANLFDATNENSKIEGNLKKDTPLSVSWQTETAEKVAYYVVYSGTDTASYLSRNPDSWVLYGSVDGETYEIIDNVTTPAMEACNNTPFAYAIDAPKAYSYFKIDISVSSDKYFQLNGIVLYTDETVNEFPLEKSTDPLTEGRYVLPMKNQFNPKTDCSFIDGDLRLDDDRGTYGNVFHLAHLLGCYDKTTLLSEKTKIYLDGVEVNPNYSYLGYTHCGFSYANSSYLLGIPGGKLTEDVESTLTLLIGDSYCVSVKFTPTVTTHAIESSQTEYIVGAQKLISTITFADDINVTTGDTVSMRLHDEHDTEWTANVTDVNDKTVTLEIDQFNTKNSLCEFTLSDGTKFSLPIDINPPTDRAKGYIQTRKNATNPLEKFDARIIVEAYQNYATAFTSATMEIVFTLSDGSTRTFLSQFTEAYKTVTAGDDLYTAADNCALFGAAVIGVPLGTQKVAAKVYFGESSDGENVIDLGEATFGAITSAADVDVIMAMNKYDTSKITVTEATDGKDINGGEGAKELFDNTTDKHGTHVKPSFTVSFTTAEPISISGIIFTIANDTNSSGVSRTYQAWTLYGISNGEKYVVASSDKPITTGVSNISGGKDPDTIDKANRDAFLVSGAGTYASYVLEVTSGTGYTQMGEITLYTAK